MEIENLNKLLISITLSVTTFCKKKLWMKNIVNIPTSIPPRRLMNLSSNLILKFVAHSYWIIRILSTYKKKPKDSFLALEFFEVCQYRQHLEVDLY
jgi:hypothetical protein